MSWVINLIQQLSSSNFTGSIEIHFFKGGIATINKHESLKPPT
jgi:hypothetical protein